MPGEEQDDLFQDEQELDENGEQELEDDDQQLEGEEAEGEEAEGEETPEGDEEDQGDNDSEVADEVYEVSIQAEDGSEEVHDVRVQDLPAILGNARNMYYENQRLKSQVQELGQLRDLGQYVAREPLLAQMLQFKLQGGSDKEILEKTYLYMQENNLFNESGQQGDGQQLDPQIGQMKSELEQLRREREAELADRTLNTNYQEVANVFTELGYETDSDPAVMQKVGTLFNKVASEIIAETYGKDKVDGFLSRQRLPKALTRAIWDEVAQRDAALVRKAGAQSGAKQTRTSVAQVRKASSSRAATNPPVRMTGANRGIAAAQQTGKRQSSSNKGSTERERAEQFRKLGL